MMIGQKKLVILSIPVALILLCIFSANCSKKKNTENYNVVLIVSDALRNDVLGCYGGEAKTPNIDNLARNGVVFENAYTNSPLTIPSSVVLLTGNYSGSYNMPNKEKSKSKIFKYHVNNEEELFSEFLNKKDFDVAMQVENRLAMGSNNTQGFLELGNFKFLKSIKNLTTLHSNYNELIKRIEKRIGITESISNFSLYQAKKYIWTYNLLDYILNLPDNRNFFILKWFLDPHAPYNPQEKFKKRININDKILSEKKEYYSRNKAKDFKRREREGKKFTKEEISYIKSLYIAEIESVDERVGYVIKSLEVRNLLKNTIIIFTADHGEFFKEHNEMGHGPLYYDQLLRIPLIISGPRIPSGKRIKSRVSNMDIIPTLNELMNMNYKNKMSGRSFKDLLLDSESKIDRKQIYFDTIGHSVKNRIVKDAILYNEFKLIITHTEDKTEYELYNIINDAEEKKNLYYSNMPLVEKILKDRFKYKELIKKQYKINLKKIKNGTSFNKKWEKTKKNLKTLGYL